MRPASIQQKATGKSRSIGPIMQLTSNPVHIPKGKMLCNRYGYKRINLWKRNLIIIIPEKNLHPSFLWHDTSGRWAGLNQGSGLCFWVLISTSISLNTVTLQCIPQQCVQLRVELSLLLQHVKEQLVLCGAGDLRLLQPAFHHLHLRLPLGCLETLKSYSVYNVIHLP